MREITRGERLERHMAVIEAVVLEHLALERRRSAQEDKRLEMEMACMKIEQQQMDDEDGDVQGEDE